MALYRRQTRAAGESLIHGVPVPTRGSGAKTPPVTNDSALRHDAVWACLTLRAGLMSSFPINVFRDVEGIPVEVKKPPVLVLPGGERWPLTAWMWASQFDLDRCGNAIGLITELDGAGRPARIDLQEISKCVVWRKKGDTEPRYRIDNVDYPASKVWHERQYAPAGCDVGLSPVALSAWLLSEQESIHEFVAGWYGNGGIPKAALKNKARRVEPKEATTVKDRFKATMTHGDLFVTGSDWEYDMMQAQTVGNEWLEARRASVPQIANYYGCPAEMINGVVSGQSVTYASMTNRNLQFLITKLGPVIKGRETSFSNSLLAKPRYAKMNTSALLRMDDETREKIIKSKLETKQITWTEARALEERAPFTPEQLAEIEMMFAIGAKAAAPPAQRDWMSGVDIVGAEAVNPLSAVPYRGGL